MQRFFQTILLISLVIFIQSCYFDKEELLYPSGNSCDTTNVTYSGTISSIMDNSCNSCHSGTDPFAGIWTDNYSDLKTIVDNGRFWGAVSHDPQFSPMPKDRPKLSDCSLLQIQVWIVEGALEN